MSEYTTVRDVSALDCIFLGTVAGVDYHEQRLILRVDGQNRQIVGRASDWPIIQRDAQIAELTALLAASEQRSVEADCHVVEVLARLSAYEELFAVRPAAESPALSESSDTAPEAPAVPPENVRRKCPYYRLRPLIVGMAAHIAREHPEQVTEPAATPAHILDALAMPEPPWRCATCGEQTHARSLKDSARCIRCVVESPAPAGGPGVEHTNGHLLAAQTRQQKIGLLASQGQQADLDLQQ